MTFRRIVVALETTRSLAALATALGLARTMEAELVGLFIEDSDLLDFAALPFAGEVGFPSATRRAIDVGAMERSLRAQARRMHEQLRERLAGQPVKWSFEVVRGRTAAALASAAAEHDLVVVSVRRNAARTRTALANALATQGVPVLVVSEGSRNHGTISVVAPRDAVESDVADVIVALAPYYGRSALLASANTERGRWAPWQERMATLLTEAGIGTRSVTLKNGSRDELDRAVADGRTRLIVALAHDAGLRDVLVDALPYPLLLLPSLVDDKQES